MRPAVAIFTDSVGWKILEYSLPGASIVAIIASAGRPQYISHLREEARKLGVSFLVQPSESSEEFAGFNTAFKELGVSLIISCSYSRKLPRRILGHSKYGGVNVHYSLLPRWRGKHPVQWAIINGDKKTGVTLHEMSEEIDTGPIIAQAETHISPDDTWLSVNGRLDAIAREMLAEMMDRLLSSTWNSSPQVNEDTCIGVARSPEDGALELSMTVREMHDKIRALVPPLAPAFLAGAVGNKFEFNRYFSIAELFELKYDNGALGFHWEEGQIIPSDLDKLGLDPLVRFSVSDRLGRKIGRCEISNYQHCESAAQVTRSTPREHREKVDWARFDSLFSGWIRAQLGILQLKVCVVE